MSWNSMPWHLAFAYLPVYSNIQHIYLYLCMQVVWWCPRRTPHFEQNISKLPAYNLFVRWEHFERYVDRGSTTAMAVAASGNSRWEYHNMSIHNRHGSRWDDSPPWYFWSWYCLCSFSLVPGIMFLNIIQVHASKTYLLMLKSRWYCSGCSVGRRSLQHNTQLTGHTKFKPGRTNMVTYASHELQFQDWVRKRCFFPLQGVCLVSWAWTARFGGRVDWRVSWCLKAVLREPWSFGMLLYIRRFGWSCQNVVISSH